MARCEDFPCCGHERGCCPDYDDAGRQLNMKCVCGATVPLSSKTSLCPACLRGDDPDDDMGPDEAYRYREYDTFEARFDDLSDDFPEENL